jgi:hypothetical protein
MITPALILDSHETWQPCAVDTIIDVGATLHDGTPITDLDQLTGPSINLPPDMTQPDTPPVGYHRTIAGGSLYWHQYWTWWLYNPKTYAGIGAHEGDWELVQLGCRDIDGNVPILITLSQHDGGEKLEYWRAELDGGSPRVYVARDSHANYPTIHRDATDQADGAGTRLAMTWCPFGSWADWPGVWGNSTNSPGQLTTRTACTTPHVYHGQARG